MFTAPPVDHLGGHLQLTAVFVALRDERTEVVDKFCGGVVPDMCRAGERLVINGAA
jgi:hypothetical protein